MTFPFTFKYSRRLSRVYSETEIKLALNYIKDFMTDKTAEDIEINDTQLVYKASLLGPRWNWNILSSIEKGKFNMYVVGHETILTYEIFMYRTIIIGTLMSIGGGISSKLIWVGLYFFLGVVGLNWITAVNRHKNMLTQIISNIEKGPAANNGYDPLLF